MAINGALVVEWAVLDAQWFTLPQRRKRVFTVAIYDPDAASRCSEQILPIAESVSRHIAKDRRKAGQTSPKTDAGDIESGEWWDGGQVAATLTTTSHLQLLPEKGKFQAVLQPILVDIQRVGDIRIYSEPVQTLQARMATGGNTTPMVACEPEMLLRRITPLECERLMGFPDDHTRWKSEGMTGNMKFRSEQADSHRYKQLGNSVAVPVAKWVGEQVMRVHRNAYPVTPLV
jgi:DNA (cytosine-5)-methyltransferase 1